MYSRNSRRAVSWVQYQFIFYVNIQQFNVFTFYQLKIAICQNFEEQPKKNEIKEFNII